MNRKRIIIGILREMAQNSITVEDLTREMSQNPEFLPRKFDLLCVVDGLPTRVPFDRGRHLNPVAIFPFVGDWYLELEQQTEMPRASADIDRIPDRDIWFEVLKIADDLNAQLKAMNKPQLLGSYFARGGYLNWIVRASEEDGKFKCEENYYASDVKATIRYCGKLETKK